MNDGDMIASSIILRATNFQGIAIKPRQKTKRENANEIRMERGGESRV